MLLAQQIRFLIFDWLAGCLLCCWNSLSKAREIHSHGTSKIPSCIQIYRQSVFLCTNTPTWWRGKRWFTRHSKLTKGTKHFSTELLGFAHLSFGAKHITPLLVRRISSASSSQRLEEAINRMPNRTDCLSCSFRLQGLAQSICKSVATALHLHIGTPISTLGTHCFSL